MEDPTLWEEPDATRRTTQATQSANGQTQQCTVDNHYIRPPGSTSTSRRSTSRRSLSSKPELRKTCEACRKRKQRCDGEKPCARYTVFCDMTCPHHFGRFSKREVTPSGLGPKRSPNTPSPAARRCKRAGIPCVYELSQYHRQDKSKTGFGKAKRARIRTAPSGVEGTHRDVSGAEQQATKAASAASAAAAAAAAALLPPRQGPWARDLEASTGTVRLDCYQQPSPKPPTLSSPLTLLLSPACSRWLRKARCSTRPTCEARITRALGCDLSGSTCHGALEQSEQSRS